MKSRRYTWAVVRASKLTDLVAHHGWRWGHDPRRMRPCLLAPNGRVFDFRARPELAIREHPVINEQLL